VFILEDTLISGKEEEIDEIGNKHFEVLFQLQLSVARQFDYEL